MAKKYSVLIIDDDPDISEVIEYLVEDFAIVKVLNSFEDLPSVQSKHFDFILCDLHLPQIEPKEVVPKLLSTFKNPDIIIVSGASESDPIVGYCIEQGAKGFLTKPVSSPKQILDLFESLDSKKSEMMAG